MPRIKRWFPVSHDINHSPTMRELAREFGLAGWRIWFEILSIADRVGEDIDCTSEGALSRLTSAAETRLKVTRKVIEALLKAKCIATIDQQNHVTRVLNYREYHRTEERKKFPPDLTKPDHTIPNRIKKNTSPPSSEALELTQLLADRIFTNFKNRTPPKESQLLAWAKVADLIHVADHHDWNLIREVLEWSQADDFWRSNILSMNALRKHWDKLVARKENGNGQSKQNFAGQPKGFAAIPEFLAITGGKARG